MTVSKQPVSVPETMLPAVILCGTFVVLLLFIFSDIKKPAKYPPGIAITVRRSNYFKKNVNYVQTVSYTHLDVYKRQA